MRGFAYCGQVGIALDTLNSDLRVFACILDGELYKKSLVNRIDLEEIVIETKYRDNVTRVNRTPLAFGFFVFKMPYNVKL
jgi:hypothetical protein